ncbi:HAMP domain-containing sensor histidine kinase [Marinilabiliaceae bacterium ANBcel2]|nr:HAMP domain-containing sensor histidine kinase [Marinilabiliaceae bacterium ANBcel2]
MPILKTNPTRVIKILIKRQLGPSSINSEGINYWRERIFHYFAILTVVLGTIAYICLGGHFFIADKFLLFAIISLHFIITLPTLLLQQIDFKYKTGWILFTLFSAGTALLFNPVTLAPALILLFCSTILAITLSGATTGGVYVILNITALISAGIYLYSNIFKEAVSPHLSLQTYINISLLFFILNILALTTLISLINGLTFSVKKGMRYQKILRKEQEHLLIARKKAEESDRLKTSFLANMSHEIRTPMNAIIGFSNLISNKNISEDEKKSFISLIKTNANSLMSLVEDILDISKMESGQFEINYKPSHLHKALDELYDYFYQKIETTKQNNINLYLKRGISNENLHLLTDIESLKKILFNLIDNSIKFTYEGYIEFGYIQKREDIIEFYVKDTGIGIPKDSEEHIFERFYKCSNNESKLYEGIGIGLTIARNLVEYLGGKISVEKASTKGTTFKFTIPFHQVAIKQTAYTPSIDVNVSQRIYHKVYTY